MPKNNAPNIQASCALSHGTCGPPLNISQLYRPGFVADVCNKGLPFLRCNLIHDCFQCYILCVVMYYWIIMTDSL